MARKNVTHESKTPPQVQTYGALFRAERLRRGYKQTTVASKVGLSRAAMSNIESGKHRTSDEVLRKLCDLYGIAPDQIGVLLPDPKPQEMPPAPDHPGVAALAADASLRHRHRVTPDELRILSEMVVIVNNQSLQIATAADALHFLQIVRGAGAVGP